MTVRGYAIRGGVEGRERLRVLAEVMGARTRALLARVGIARGATCVDLGCGAGDVTCELARLSGSTGRAVGIDLDEVKIAAARRAAEEHGFVNVAFEV